MAKLISFSKVKLIFTEHCTSNRRLENKIFKFIDQHCYRFYDGVVAISKEINEIVLKHSKLNISKIHTIENGVNLNTIRKAPSLNKKDILPSFKEEDKLLIQVAGFRAQKDQTTLIKAMQLLPLEVKLVLAGEGVLKKKCQDLVETLNLKERVVFLGLRMDIPQLLKTADVVVLSSKYEGLSLSSIEGMAAGKPFVASDVPGLREVVKGAGILFPMSNVKQLAKEISKLLDSPKHYQFVANACQKRAAKYDIYKMVDQHINIYKSMYEA
jgi:glycosyltransferase involved in cell wall biosynthesis